MTVIEKEGIQDQEDDGNSGPETERKAPNEINNVAAATVHVDPA